MYMPPAPKEAASAVQGSATIGDASAPGAGQPLPPPPTFGKQMAQLVLIPAFIALVAIGLFAIFGSLAATPDSLEDQLNRLRQSSGMGGNLIAGAQDPRYKDRCVAAYHIAAMIQDKDGKITLAPLERKKLSDALVGILHDRVHVDDKELITYLVLSIGRLAQEGGFGAILERADSTHPQVRQGVIGGVLHWANEDVETARIALPTLTKLLADPFEPVRTQAAAALWKIARPGDTEAIAALREAMASIGRDPEGRGFEHTRWHAAISLAAVGDAQGSAFVADTLLNREALAQLAADVTGKLDTVMTVDEQERMIAMTLHYVSTMNDERIWQRVKELAEKDTSVNVRSAATQLLQQRKGGGTP